jgi:phenylacetate-CoA ligase
VELNPSGFDGKVESIAELQKHLTEKMKGELWVRPKIELVPAGSLPVAEGKAKRVIDKRSI